MTSTTLFDAENKNQFPLTQCPVCRAKMKGNEPISQPCRRCQNDLQFVRACGIYATYWQQKAHTALEQNDPFKAMSSAKRALSYVDAPALRALLQKAQQAWHQTTSHPPREAE